MKYKHVVLGGTFDHLHKGHERMLLKAIELSDCITVGLATDDLYRHKLFAKSIESYDVRKSAIEDFFMAKSFIGSLDIIPIFNIYGTTLSDETLEALIVTRDTLANGNLINEKRVKKGLSRLELVIVPMVSDSHGRPVTSERIRAGEIDRSGNNYIDLFKKDLHLPDSMREELRKPIGLLYRGNERDHGIAARAFKKIFKKDSPLLISVGDISTISINSVGIKSNLSIIDHRTRRRTLNYQDEKKAIKNKPHYICSSAALHIYKKVVRLTISEKCETLNISGEEDLLVLPAIVLSPLGAIIIYGQFEAGIVAVTVTEETKSSAVRLLNSFLKSK